MTTEIKVNITEKQIQEGVEKCINDALKSSYSNPINDAVQKALKDQSGVIIGFVNDLITNAVSDPKFKEKLADSVLASMIQMALKK